MSKVLEHINAAISYLDTYKGGNSKLDLKLARDHMEQARFLARQTAQMTEEGAEWRRLAARGANRMEGSNGRSDSKA